MSWLRIDDGFPEHPKLVALGKPADRWTWLELLAYCARRDTHGVIPDGIDDLLRRVTPKFLQRCEDVGLLDRDHDGNLTVHDWKIYNGASLEERVAAFLATNPEATANEVQRSTGGNRQAILGIVAEFNRFQTGSESGSESGSAPVPESSERFQQVVPSPAPTPTPEEPEGSSVSETSPSLLPVARPPAHDPRAKIAGDHLLRNMGAPDYPAALTAATKASKQEGAETE